MPTASSFVFKAFFYIIKYYHHKIWIDLKLIKLKSINQATKYSRCTQYKAKTGRCYGKIRE